MGALDFRVFTARREGLNRAVPPGHESLMWVANSATLVYGESDAILVDTFLTKEQGRALLEAVIATRKNLIAIYVTHAHGDHFFGLDLLLSHFPDARAWARPEVVGRMGHQISPEYLEEHWREAFPGQIPERTPVAEPLEGDLELEGHSLVAIPLGHTDTEGTTCLHVPAIDLVMTGDAVYNGIHPFQGETTRENRREWLAALDTIASLRAKAVVAGHKVPEADDSPGHVAETRRYFEDFARLDDETTTAPELFERMLALYPDYANVGSLWGAATTAKAP